MLVPQPDGVVPAPPKYNGHYWVRVGQRALVTENTQSQTPEQVRFPNFLERARFVTMQDYASLFATLAGNEVDIEAFCRAEPSCIPGSASVDAEAMQRLLREFDALARHYNIR